MNISKAEFSEYIKDFDFKGLFNYLGWDNDRTAVPPIQAGGSVLTPKIIADKNGFKIIECRSEHIPGYAERIKTVNALKKLFHEQLVIFSDNKKREQVWLYCHSSGSQQKKTELRYNSGQDAERLYQRASGLIFELDEQDNITIIDVIDRVRSNFEANSERVTRKFYDSFKKQHVALLGFISGIKARVDKEWYASIMLNRLMFCYFMQRRGFLDGDRNYLRNKLAEAKEKLGHDKFYSFYRSFLLVLFRKGFASYDHPPEVTEMLGTIPYLNGGLFDLHEVERVYPDIGIADEAFESIFELFDRYEWHLDTRDCAAGNEINPDVLGYIFEKYINDRSSMGAYYTQEDVTGYISRSTILPYLLESTKKACPEAFEPDGAVWAFLKNNGDSYIFDSVKHGTEVALPDFISIGLDALQPGLRSRRKRWNEPAFDEFALPSETWREAIERRARYEQVSRLISCGRLTDIADLITYNLDIAGFVRDLLDTIEDSSFIHAFYNALESVTVLDPTCGSGAFLFAALNILEPLYDSCLSRMDDYLNHNYKGILDGGVKTSFGSRLNAMESSLHPSKRYFIYKSIILNNLYGVDIMREAAETAKLRLFLKLVSTAEPDYNRDNIGIEPLPDIDFNIKSGNALIGYASEQEVEDALNGSNFARHMISETMSGITELSKATARYKQLQLTETDYKTDVFKTVKAELSERQTALRDTLNVVLRESGHNTIKRSDWNAHYSPFHWISEFYAILAGNGGFDVIIGNPPYVEYSKKNVAYRLSPASYDTFSAKNLYAYVYERAKALLHNESAISMIVQISAVSTPSMKDMTQEILKDCGSLWVSNYATRPACLFEGVTMNLSILNSVISRSGDAAAAGMLYTSHYNRWQQQHRQFVFDNVHFARVGCQSLLFDYSLPKLEAELENAILSKLVLNRRTLGSYLDPSPDNENRIYYRSAGGRYFKIFMDRDFGTDSTSNKSKAFSDRYDVHTIIAVLSSSLWWWYYTLHFDMYNCKDYMMFSFHFDYRTCKETKKLANLGRELCDFLYDTAERKAQQYKTTGTRVQLIFNPSKAKPIIDKIDTLLAEHYGFTEEELDYIINYDIKYRTAGGGAL